jgi:predicted DNA binding CopG/RHH family protein
VSDKKTTIRVSESTKERLKQHGDMGMTYDEVVNDVLDRLEALEEQHRVNDE